MTAKLKRDVRLPKTSLLERLDRPKGVSFSDFTEYRKSSAEALDARFKIIEVQQDIQTKDIAWLKTGQESHTSELKDFADQLERFVKPSLWPIMLTLFVLLISLVSLYLGLKANGMLPRPDGVSRLGPSKSWGHTEPKFTICEGDCNFWLPANGMLPPTG